MDAPHQAVSLWKMEPQGWFWVNVGRGRREENKRKNEKQTLHFLSHVQNLNLYTYISHGCRKETAGGGRGFTRAVEGKWAAWW